MTNRWAIKTLVRDLESKVALMLRMRSASVVESSAEVYPHSSVPL